MVLGKRVAILTGNGAEIRPLEMGRKGPVVCRFSNYILHKVFSLLAESLCCVVEQHTLSAV